MKYIFIFFSVIRLSPLILRLLPKVTFKATRRSAVSLFSLTPLWESCWWFVASAELSTSPHHHKAHFNLHLRITTGFLVHISKFRRWKQRHGGRQKGMFFTEERICLKSEQGRGAQMRVCPFPWQQGWELALPCTVSPYKGAAGLSAAQQYLFNVIAQRLLFVDRAARCEPHKNSKAKWIRI